MALQSEIQAQWNTTERSQLSSINYLSGDNNHGVIPHERSPILWIDVLTGSMRTTKVKIHNYYTQWAHWFKELVS